MIAKLALADAVTNLRVWTGVLLVTAVTAFVGALTAGVVESGVRRGGVVALAVFAITGVVAVFALVAAGVVLGAVAALTVVLQQRGYALWQLVGVQPGTVRRVVLVQLLLVATVGAAVGAVLAPPLLQPTMDFVFTGAQGFAGLRAASSPLAVVAAAVVVIVVTVLAGRRAARAASRVAVLDVLREPDAPGRRTGVLRWVLAVLLLAAAVGLASAQVGNDPAKAELPLLIAGALAAAALTTVGAVLFPALVRLWTAAVPTRASASWHLARATGIDGVSRGAATIGPLLVAVALAGVLFSVDGTLGAASARPRAEGGGLSPQVVVLLLGGPVLIAVTGTVVTVFMSGRSRGRELALLRAAGAGTGTVLLAAAAEAVIYVGTALIGALVVMLLAAGGASLVAAASGTTGALVVAIGPALAVAGGALVLMLVATVVPTWVALRADVPGALAAE